MALGARAGGRLLGARAAVSWSCCLLAARVPEWQEAKHLQPSQPATYSQPCLTGCTARLRCSDFELESTTNRAEGDIGGARSLPASHGMLPCRCLAGCGLMQSWCCRHAKLMLHATTGSGSAPLVAGLPPPASSQHTSLLLSALGQLKLLNPRFQTFDSAAR